jgi:hypothetical protein
MFGEYVEISKFLRGRRARWAAREVFWEQWWNKCRPYLEKNELFSAGVHRLELLAAPLAGIGHEDCWCLRELPGQYFLIVYFLLSNSRPQRIEEATKK